MVGQHLEDHLGGGGGGGGGSSGGGDGGVGGAVCECSCSTLTYWIRHGTGTCCQWKEQDPGAC